jgi:hypothetical protein
MIRLIVDNYEGRHNDLFLIIDSTPWYLKTADSYYLSDFLEINNDSSSKKDLSTELINFWADRIRAIEKGQRKFLPFDLSDQYIGGLLLEKSKQGYKVKHVWTNQIVGHNVGKSNLDRQIIDNNVEFEDSEPTVWIISEEGIFNGLEWSKRELTK